MTIRYPRDRRFREEGNSEDSWIPPYQVRGRLIKSGVTMKPAKADFIQRIASQPSTQNPTASDPTDTRNHAKSEGLFRKWLTFLYNKATLL